ncbi:MAG: LamG domain-containing protein [Sedimentisphaerales bacterium]
MQRVCLLTLAVISAVLTLGGGVLAEQGTFEYPCYLLDVYNPDDDCWKGMGVDGRWPVPVVPKRWLVGPPPSDFSGVTMPRDHWIDLKFRGRLIDGPGDDILLIELGQMGEQALIFITDGTSQGPRFAGTEEYLLGIATALDTGVDAATEIGFDIAGISLPFVPCGLRLAALDLGGGSPGFDIANVRARTYVRCGDIACNPIPVDGAKNVSVDAVLSWSPGRSADKHVVYFGTAITDVDANATAVSNPPQPQDVNSFDPGSLELGKTYYWRVDEIRDSDANSPLTGNIWRFTVTDHLVVDDFDSYNNNDNRIYDIWAETGEAFIEISTNPAYKCRQSMAFYYYYDDYFYSEVTCMFSQPQDWAAIDGKVLELFFYGNADNNTHGQMYVGLSDGDVNIVVPYEGDMNDITEQAWQLWRINLQILTSLNLHNIKAISIGFRAKPTQPAQPGSGIVYFDNIRLYPSRCLELNRPAADVSGDCAVDFEDFQEMAHSWLDRSYNIYPVAAPNAPRAWYKFDGNANDSSGNGHHCESSGNPTYVPGIYSQAISFDGYEDSVNITNAAELFRTISTKITIAFWQYGADSPHLTDTICCSNYIYGVDNPAIAINLGCWQQPGRYNWDCGYPWSFDSRLSGDHRYKGEWSGRWNHWAFIKDADKGIMQIFLNGALYDSRTGASSPISRITSFEIGSGWYGGYDGLIDDFRIYNYVLSQREIAYIATNGTGIFDQLLLSPADLNADGQINFEDFAVLANSWLDEQLWP